MICECHGEPMEWNAARGRRGGGSWRCVVKRRAAQRAHWHRKRKHDPDYQLDRQLREMCRIRVSY